MTERKSAPKAVYRDVYGAVYGAVYGTMCLFGQGAVSMAVSKAVWLNVYRAMCGAMYNERHEQHTYADDFVLRCRHTE